MRLIRYLLFSLLILIGSNLLAQVNCYESARNKGIELYNKGDFQAAAKKFEAAKFCTDLPDNHDLDTWLSKCVVTVKLSEKRLEFGAEFNDEQAVEVITKAKTFKVSTPPEWCSITQDGKMLQVYCEDNLEVVPREAEITITAAGKTAVLEIYQEAATLEVEFQPKSIKFTSQCDTVFVKVLTNVTDWVVDTIPTWVIAEKMADSLLIACRKNTSSEVREADVVIMVTDDFFPLHISQLPGDTVLRGNKKEILFNNGYSSDGFTVQCNMTQWKASSTDSWIEVSKFNDSVKVYVAENPSVFSRHGTVNLSCGTRRFEVLIHQKPHVSEFVKPESELIGLTSSEKESVMVTSVPSELVVYIDDTIAKTTPFEFFLDYEHHSLLLGFERHEFLFNEKQKDVVFKPGLRFAAFTFTAPKNLGLRTGFINAKGLGAYSHFQASRPLVKEFACDTMKADGYHFMVGPVFSVIEYAAIYAGVGVGIHEGPTVNGVPNFNLDYEAGVMGMYKNATISMGFRTSKWGFNKSAKRTTFVFGIGGYLKRYHDTKRGYCTSDSRRWVSLNYMTRPVVNSKGLMIGDIGKDKLRTYFKAMYAHPDDTQRNVDASFGLLFTPVNGIIDFCFGAGAGTSITNGQVSIPTVEAEAGFIVSLWRIPLTVMLHESDLAGNRHLYVDLGIGFHLGEFRRSSYK